MTVACYFVHFSLLWFDPFLNYFMGEVTGWYHITAPFVTCMSVLHNCTICYIQSVPHNCTIMHNLRRFRTLKQVPHWPPLGEANQTNDHRWRNGLVFGNDGMNLPQTSCEYSTYIGLSFAHGTFVDLSFTSNIQGIKNHVMIAWVRGLGASGSGQRGPWPCGRRWAIAWLWFLMNL